MNKVFLQLVTPVLIFTCSLYADEPRLLLSEDFSPENNGSLAEVLEAHPLLEIVSNEGVNGTYGL